MIAQIPNNFLMILLSRIILHDTISVNEKKYGKVTLLDFGQISTIVRPGATQIETGRKEP